MINRIDFEGWVKFVAANLYDYAAIEKHPLTSQLIPQIAGSSRGEQVRQLFQEAISSLRPTGKDFTPALPEGRPFYILSQRYLEGVPLHELTVRLALSERQLRRDHHRALEALSVVLWDRLNLDGQAEEEGSSNPLSFELHRERLDPTEVILGVWKTMERRAEQEGVQVMFNLDPLLATILADRVILRQVLISLFNNAFHSLSTKPITISAKTLEAEVLVSFTFMLPEDEAKMDEVNKTALDTVRYWAERTNARFQQTLKPDGTVDLTLLLPRGDQPIILVVDDQEPAIALFQRYLSRSNVLVVGLTQAGQALELAQHLQPVLIALDVMMPQVDGWEVLQALKLNKDTSNIPVLVCSAWQEPELAISLGAAGFLKKPITQKQFLDALHLMDII